MRKGFDVADTAPPDVDELAKAVQALSDKEAIREQIYLYCRGVDRLQTPMVGAAFHTDATDNHGMFVGGVKEFLEVGEKFAAAPDSPIRRTLHHVGNILIELDGDRAWSEAYFIAYHRREDEGGDFDEFIGGRYVDRFERRDGRWAIAHRDVVYEWSRVMSGAERWWDSQDLTHFIFGKRSREDVVFLR